MDNSVVHGIKIFGIFIIPDPIDPAEPNTKLQPATPLNPAMSSGNADNQKKKEEEEPQPPKPVIRRLTIKFGGGNSRAHNPLITPELRCLLRSIDVSEHHNPTHILTRTLFDSDVKKSMARLTLPRKQILMAFLSEREERLLGEHGGDGKPKGMKVTVVDPLLVVRTLDFKRWNYKAAAATPGDTDKPPKARGWSYVLNGGWTAIVDSNGFAGGDTIQVWSFRMVNGSLGFIIFKQ